jgi:hypothetical protein
VGSALLRAETTVAETVEFLRRADPGQGLRERRITDSRNVRSSRVFFLLNFGELVKHSGRNIGYGPTIETVRVPIDKIVALIIECFLVRGCLRGPFAADEQAHIMALKTIDKNRDVVASHIVKAATEQLKTLISEVAHGRREIDFTGKPRFYGMLVTRFDINKMGTDKRPNVIGSDFRYQ